MAWRRQDLRKLRAELIALYTIDTLRHSPKFEFLKEAGNENRNVMGLHSAGDRD